MDTQKNQDDKSHSLQKLYPGLNEEQLREAAENLDRYLALVIRIDQRLREQERKDAQAGRFDRS